MSEINWGLYNIPNYDMTDLRKSKQLAFDEGADIADMIEKNIRDEKKTAQESAMELLKGLGLLAQV